MAVDWSKYGVETEEKERKSASRVDWDKYDPQVQQERARQRIQSNMEAMPELYNPMIQKAATQERFRAPVETKVRVDNTKKSEGTGRGRTPFSLEQTQNYNEVRPFNPTIQDIISSPNQVNDTRTPTERWVDETLERNQRGASKTGFFSAVDRALEPITRYGTELIAEIPGVSAFQRDAAKALGVESFAAPEVGPEWVNAPARLVGSIAGMAAGMQGAGIRPVATFDKISSGAANIAGRLGVNNRIAQSAIGGIAAGATEGMASSAIAGRTDANELLNAGLVGGALGGVGNTVFSAIANRMRRNNVPEEAVQELLALPAPRERGRANSVITDDVIMNADTRTQPAPLGLPAPEMIPPTTARISQRQNPFRQQFEELAAEVQRRQASGQLTPGREMEEVESIWSQMAGRDGVSLDELIQRAYPSSPSRVSPDLVQRARGTQYAREVAGAPFPVRSQSERFANPQGVVSQAATPIERIGQNPSLRERKQPISTIPTNRQVDNVPAPIREAEEIVQAVNQPRVRDKVYTYLDDAEKAARERIASRRNRLSANPIDEWKDYAIVMAAKLGKGTIRATDFAEELVKEFGEKARPHATRVFRQTKAILKNQSNKVQRSIEEADTFNNSGKGDSASFDSKINRNVKKKTTTWQQKFDKLRSQFVDDLAQFERLEKNVTGSVASAEDSLYKTARLFKGVPERAAQIVTDRLSPIIKSIEDAGHSADDLGRYALAKHAQDVNAAGYKSGFTNAEIADVIQKYGKPEMRAAQQALVKVNRDMLQELVGSGVVSDQLAKVLNDRWKNYIPLFRSFDDDKVEFSGGLSKALANVSDPIVALKGSERAVIDPLENMVKNIMQSVNSAERNKVAAQLSKLARRDTEGTFIRKLDPNEKVGRKNVVTVREGGEPVKYEVEPEVYKTFLNMDQESSNMLVNILSKPASVLRAGATLTPEFSLRNPMRDVLQAFVTSESGFTPLDFAAGLIQTIKRGDLYKDWIDNLGAYGNVMSQDRNVHRQALEKVLKQPPGKKFVNIVNPRSWLNVLRAISDTTESATKVGEYRAALRKGASKQEAAYRSRDLMDFARSGSSIRQTNRMVAFLNANIQGKSKLIRSIKDNPVGTIPRMVASTTIPTVGIFILNKYLGNETQKQTIADAPDWQKDAFWLVAIPGTDQVARIPKPFDIAPIFANLPERALDFVYNNDKKAFDGFARRVLSDSALPMQLSGLLPFIEGMANYSFFREGPIIPQRESGLQPRDQYDPIRTTETAKLLARGADALTGGKGPLKNFASPRIMDNTIKGLTAGLGTYATSAIDTVLKGLKIVDRPDAPEKRLEQRPLAKAFLVDPLQGGKSMDKFYEEREKLSSEKASASLNERPFTKSGRLNQLNSAADTIGKINKRVREIEQSDMTPKEKRNQIDELVKRRNEIARQVVRAGR